MSLHLHIIVTYIKENIITKLQKLYSLPRNPRAGNKSPALFVKKPLCTSDLSPARKIFIERPGYVVATAPEKCKSTISLIRLTLISFYFHFLLKMIISLELKSVFLNNFEAVE